MSDLEKEIRAAFFAGFRASGEGWNGEYPDLPVEDDEHLKAEADKHVAQALTASGYGESEDTQRGEASQPVLPSELVEAARELEPYLDRLLCYASTTSEHEPNRVVKRLRAALASLPDPLPTVESVRAAARAEYEAEPTPTQDGVDALVKAARIAENRLRVLHSQNPHDGATQEEVVCAQLAATLTPFQKG